MGGCCSRGPRSGTQASDPTEKSLDLQRRASRAASAGIEKAKAAVSDSEEARGRRAAEREAEARRKVNLETRARARARAELKRREAIDEAEHAEAVTRGQLEATLTRKNAAQGQLELVQRDAQATRSKRFASVTSRSKLKKQALRRCYFPRAVPGGRSCGALHARPRTRAVRRRWVTRCGGACRALGLKRARPSTTRSPR
jgi:hypothetical protein